MPVRAAKKTYSDRGSIKDLTARHEEGLDLVPTNYELRIKKLYELAQDTNNGMIKADLGFITTDYIADKNALPLSVYRIRKIVSDIKSKSPEKIDKLSQEFLDCMSGDLSPQVTEYLTVKHAMVKRASVRKTPMFWRASRQ